MNHDYKSDRERLEKTLDDKAKKPSVTDQLFSCLESPDPQSRQKAMQKLVDRFGGYHD